MTFTLWGMTMPSTNKITQPSEVHSVLIQNASERVHLQQDEAYGRYILLIFIGILIVCLGSFMITDIHKWEIFSVWLPLSLIVSGIALSTSKIYSSSLGLLLLLCGAMLWFHDEAMSNFPDVTRTIDWLLIVTGFSIIGFATVQIWRVWVYGHNQ